MALPARSGYSDNRAPTPAHMEAVGFRILWKEGPRVCVWGGGGHSLDFLVCRKGDEAREVEGGFQGGSGG